ncbi:MAG: amidohydrolase family protein [Planctomycetota bacterium]|nr:amidohydrolase family protein [Planctomycetota bacterium]
MRLSRPKRLLALIGLVALLGLGLPACLEHFAAPSPLLGLRGDTALEGKARGWVRAFEDDLLGQPLIDVHAHLAGRGRESNCWMNPRMENPLRPLDFFRGRIFSAAGLPDKDAPDVAWIDHLAQLSSAMPFAARHHVLPFDQRYDQQGRANPEGSDFFVPNDWALFAQERHPKQLVAAASIHPLRSDSLDELRRVAARGVRVVKWLPSAQGIELGDKRLLPFYAETARLGVWLLIHTGTEGAVGEIDQNHLNNPLLVRAALDGGAKVIVGHCAAGGLARDLDDPSLPMVPAVDLFLRLLDERGGEGRLLGDISTICNVNHFAVALPAILSRPDLHGMLVNGSDWPLPAVGPLIMLWPLERAGFLDKGDREVLQGVFASNPLLFEVLLKSRVHLPESQLRLDPVVFRARPELGLE